MMTTIVPWITCDWVGHSTFLSSAQDSATKRRKPPPGTRRAPVCVLGGCAAGRTCCWRARARWVTPCCSPCCSRARRWRRRWRVLRANATRPLFVGLPYGLRAGSASPGLLVRCVAAAPAAVLLQLDAVGRVSLRLRALVVAAPALGAGCRDCVSDSGRHSFLSLGR